MDLIPLTRENFDEHKKRIIKIIDDIKIDDLDPQYQMSMDNGIKMGNHANECDSCNIFHYLMGYVIDKHRLVVGK